MNKNSQSRTIIFTFRRRDEDLGTSRTSIRSKRMIFYRRSLAFNVQQDSPMESAKVPEGDDVFLCNKANIQVSLCRSLFRAVPNGRRYWRTVMAILTAGSMPCASQADKPSSRPSTGNCIALSDGSFVAATGNDLHAPANRTHEKILRMLNLKYRSPRREDWYSLKGE